MSQPRNIYPTAKERKIAKKIQLLCKSKPIRKLVPKDFQEGGDFESKTNKASWHVANQPPQDGNDPR